MRRGEHTYTVQAISPANMNKDEIHFRLENKQASQRDVISQEAQAGLCWSGFLLQQLCSLILSGAVEPRELRLVRRLKFVFISFPSIICLHSVCAFPAPRASGCVILGHLKKRSASLRNVLNSCKPPQTLIPKKQTKYPELFFLLKNFFRRKIKKTSYCTEEEMTQVKRKETQKVTSRLSICRRD